VIGRLYPEFYPSKTYVGRSLIDEPLALDDLDLLGDGQDLPIALEREL
jgi:hypothetical protein